MSEEKMLAEFMKLRPSKELFNLIKENKTKLLIVLSDSKDNEIASFCIKNTPNE